MLASRNIVQSTVFFTVFLILLSFLSVSYSFSPIRSGLRPFSRNMATFMKKSIRDLNSQDLSGKKVLVRADLNVPLKDGVVTDDTRLRGAIPTLRYLLDNNAKVLLTSHLGRPKGKVDPKYTLAPITGRLSELLGKTVPLVNDCVGPVVDEKVKDMQNGDIVLLENLRFHSEEEKNDPEFSRQLSKHADLFVNDAFGTAHRAHSSTEGVTKFIDQSVAGFLLEKELEYLSGHIDNPKRPFTAIIGGSKVSSKITVIEKLLDKVDKLVIGGGMIFTFLKAKGYNVGNSLVEPEFLELALKIEQLAKDKGVELILPSDVVVANEFSATASDVKEVSIDNIPEGYLGLDIGPNSIKTIESALASSATVIWNGPMGVFEFDKFATGTFSIAKSLAKFTQENGLISIIGGGDSVAAVEKIKLGDKMTHISTGGGASLELLEGKVLPGVAALKDR